MKYLIAGSMESRVISYRLLADVAHAQDRDLDRCMAALSTVTRGWEQAQSEELRLFLRKTFLAQLNQKWRSVDRKADDFEKKYNSWLQKSFRICQVKAVVPVEESVGVAESINRNETRGRPTLGFAESSERSKRRKIKETREELDAELLRRAAKPTRIPPDRALAFFLINKFTKAQYENVRKLLKGVDLPDVLPAYNHLREAKNITVPDGLTVTETECTVPLASLLQHTSRRILESKSTSELDSLDSNLTLVAKWGCDGSSGHRIYKQNFGADGCSDENIFLTLKIHCVDDEAKCFWLNPKPASTRFGRLMRFQYVKESKAVIVAEVCRVEDERG